MEAIQQQVVSIQPDPRPGISQTVVNAGVTYHAFQSNPTLGQEYRDCGNALYEASKRFQSNPTLGQEYRPSAAYGTQVQSCFNPTRPSARNIARIEPPT